MHQKTKEAKRQQGPQEGKLHQIHQKTKEAKKQRGATKGGCKQRGAPALEAGPVGGTFKIASANSSVGTKLSSCSA